MDLSNEVLMDFVLNLAGCLAVAGLSLVLYTVFHRRGKTLSTATGPGSRWVDQERGKNAGSDRERRRIEFVRLSEQPNNINAGSGEIGMPDRTAAATSRRSRVEVMGLARRMFEAGASPEKIKAVLPISDAEVALLNCHKK